MEKILETRFSVTINVRMKRKDKIYLAGRDGTVLRFHACIDPMIVCYIEKVGNCNVT